MNAEERAEREDAIRELSLWADKFSRETVLFLLEQLDGVRADEQEAFAVVLENRANELRHKFGLIDETAGELNLQAQQIRARFFRRTLSDTSIICHELLERLRKAEEDVDRRAERLAHRMRDERNEALAVLKLVESVAVNQDNFCPLCWHLSTNGHGADCRLAKVLEAM